MARRSLHFLHHGPICRERLAKWSFSGAENRRKRTQHHSCNDARAQRLNLSSFEVLACIAEHIGVPEHLLVAKRQSTYAVRSAVPEARGGTINDFPAAIAQSLAKIHILEPDRKELLVEPADLSPRRARDCKASACRLLDLLRSASSRHRGNDIADSLDYAARTGLRAAPRKARQRESATVEKRSPARVHRRALTAHHRLPQPERTPCR